MIINYSHVLKGLSSDFPLFLSNINVKNHYPINSLKIESLGT